MPIIRYGEPLNVIVAARGHPYDRNRFMAIFDDMPGVNACLVEHPGAARLMNPHGLRGVDVLVLYDMPGIDFRAAGGPRFVAPEPDAQRGLLALLEEGRVGVVALHHAIAGWPAWPAYAELLGGRFRYRPDGSAPDSGYRHEVTHELSFVDPAHPIAEGLPPAFELRDEVYLFEVQEARVRPLLRSSHSFRAEGFYSASQAVDGRMYSNEGWSHPPGSNLVGWTKRACNAPLVYLQPGDGPETYADPHYRRLLGNAVRWAASDAARAEVATLPG